MDATLDPCANFATACGKVILLGEHAVVHGETAVAASIGRAADASASWSDQPDSSLGVSDERGRWDVPLGSELIRAFGELLRASDVQRPVRVGARILIPTRAGLGSSAALGVAIARAVLALDRQSPTTTRVVEIASAWERVFHGNPSGIDVAVAARGGCLAFSRKEGACDVKMPRPLPLCIARSGERASTHTMVEAASSFLRIQPDQGARVLALVRAAVDEGLRALGEGDPLGLGSAMNANQRVLRAWGLSTPAIDALCSCAVHHGACGAKLTGAGGGGCVIALAPGHEAQVIAAWKSLGFDGFIADAGVPGS